MNLRNVYILLGVEALVLFIVLIFSIDNLTQSIDNLFIATLGLLIFTPVFYGAAVSSEVRTLETMFRQTKSKLSKEELEDVLAKADEVQHFMKDLRLNKWLLVSVYGYLLSLILSFLPRSDITTALQIVFFWAGLSASILLVTSWLFANVAKD